MAYMAYNLYAKQCFEQIMHKEHFKCNILILKILKIYPSHQTFEYVLMPTYWG